jgi:hypothetical protein
VIKIINDYGRIVHRISVPYRSVSDPYSFFTDPDPEVDAGDQYGSGSNPDPGL